MDGETLIAIAFFILAGVTLIAVITFAVVSSANSSRDTKAKIAQANAEKMYFIFESDDDKVIKAFRIVVAKNVNTEDFIECCERYTDPLFEYNENHRGLNQDEFTLLKEVLK